MADGTAARSSRGHRTICLPISEEAYAQAVDDPGRVPAAARRGLPGDPRAVPAGLRPRATS